MNILITSQAAGVAGSTYSVSYLAKGLAQRKHNIWVACPQGTLLWELLEKTDVKLVCFSFSSKFHPTSIRALASLIRDHNIQLVNAQSSRDRYSTILAKWWYKLPIKLVHTRRQLVKSMGWFGQSAFYERGTDAIIAVSEGVKESINAIGISADHVQVIYNGTPAEKYQNILPEKIEALRKHYQIHPDDIIIGCVARYKKQVQLLQALQVINRPVHVLFVGIEETPELQAIQQTWSVAHQVHYTGSLTNDEVLHHYCLFTMNILPSTIEGLSQALLEAMALGIPVIATRIGGNAELIQHGVNGFLFENGNTTALAKYIEQLIADVDLRISFSKAGRKTALEDFSLDRMLTQYENFFEKLIHSN
uniref:Glycosyltransferase family 4 protein n=1 Tax=Roseihalotalea indica TaxID=2867963 RepID=A0AA49JDT5_9BACT|nr:glycosyltransferase family 4 protein [Tunicatimonas sp. TK19036]